MTKKKKSSIKNSILEYFNARKDGVVPKIKKEDSTNKFENAPSKNIPQIKKARYTEDNNPQKSQPKSKIIDDSYHGTFAGNEVFIVDSDTFHTCRLGKQKYHRYEKYVGNGKIGQAIREFGLTNPKKPIILQNGEDGPMLYLRYGGSQRYA